MTPSYCVSLMASCSPILTRNRPSVGTSDWFINGMTMLSVLLVGLTQVGMLWRWRPPILRSPDSPLFRRLLPNTPFWAGHPIDLSSVAAKTLLISGSADPITGHKHGSLWQRRLPNARLEMVPGEVGTGAVALGTTRTSLRLTLLPLNQQLS